VVGIRHLVFGAGGGRRIGLRLSQHGRVIGSAVSLPILGARLATSLQARKWVFRLLVIVLSAELVHLTVHYVFKTH
jgi:hypothetical protein